MSEVMALLVAVFSPFVPAVLVFGFTLAIVLVMAYRDTRGQANRS